VGYFAIILVNGYTKYKSNSDILPIKRLDLKYPRYTWQRTTCGGWSLGGESSPTPSGRPRSEPLAGLGLDRHPGELAEANGLDLRTRSEGLG
jgi:hypothetical protein